MLTRVFRLLAALLLVVAAPPQSPRQRGLSRVEFSGAMRGLLHSHAFCPSSPCPLLPQGEKGEFGRQDNQNERRNAGSS